jgi:hypothetical protein
VKVRSLIEGAGVAILLLGTNIFPLLSPSHQLIYHDPYPVQTVVEGLAIDLLVASVFFAALLAVLDRYYPEQSTPVWAALLALFAVTVGNFVVSMLGLRGTSIPWGTAMREMVLLSVAGIALLFSLFSPRLLWGSVRAARMGLLLCGCCALWVLPELAITAIRTDPPTVDAFDRQVPTPSASHPRIVWVLLDELSYDQVYEHRQPDVKLPHFDELKRESVVFSDVQPEGYFTERILPALFLGRQVDDARSSLNGNLEIRDAKLARWTAFDQQETIFAEAKESGWTTGVAGWYNPYCHILQNVLDSCYWSYVSPFSESEEKTALANAVSLPSELLLSAQSDDSPSRSDPSIEECSEQYGKMMRAANHLIQDESIDFVFLHMPVPHPPGIYSRKTHTLGVKGTYLDNLVLADRTVKNLLDAIHGTPAAGRTILILSSDHSWRVPLWRGSPSWTAEEERASNGGKFDKRPFLLIRFPRESTGEMRTEAFPELNETEIVRAMLKGRIESPADLDRWLGRREPGSVQYLATNKR